MDKIDDVTTRSPSILMIEGVEHVLYEGFVERIKIADANLLWLNTAKMWALALYAVLIAINAFRSDSSLWLPFAGLAVISGSAVLSVFLDNRAVLTIPFAVAERDRAGEWSTLAITSQPLRMFSTNPIVTQFATVHPAMADFLLTAFSGERSRPFRERPRLPAALTTPRARRQAWAANAGPLVALVGVVAIIVAIATR
jgi:hypothetical protein